MNLLTRQIIIEARKHIGVRETARNSGPEIDQWLRRVKRPPGLPWCAAFAWCMLDDACRALGLPNPMEPTAGGNLLMIRARAHHAWTNEPGPGYIFGIDHGHNAEGAHLSHVGFVAEIREDGGLATIEGNTNSAGSREGNCVAEHVRPAAGMTLGYLDPGRLALDHSHPIADHPT